MKLIKQSFEIITPIDGEVILKQIELAARTCYKSEGKIEYEDLIDTSVAPFNVIRNYTAVSARPLIKMLLAKGHEAMLEFGGNITVKFTTDRGVSHELVRHRIASFAQESTRFCNYSKGDHITFIIPNWMDIKEDTYEHLTMIDIQDSWGIWFMAMQYAQEEYNELISKGWSPQQARSILPNSLKTEINVSANLREWRHIFKLRCSAGAHPQMIDLMNPLKKRFQSLIPILFDDL